MNPFRIEVDGAVRFRLSPASPCPCGSGEQASCCCLTTRGFQKAPAVTSPKLPATGYAQSACYAAPLCDCRGKITREHPFSETLLERLDRNGGLRVGGFRGFSAGQEKILRPNALASKILCERHNSALSSLDSNAVRLFNAFCEIEEASSGGHLWSAPRFLVHSKWESH
jgi:hypothetical protein